jgi:hypothetical protein
MKTLWNYNGYGGDFDYMLEHHKEDVYRVLRDDTVIERMYNKRKITRVLPLETATMDPRYSIWDDASDITTEDFEAMNARYPKKQRREAFESEWTKSKFNPSCNNTYNFTDMGHRQLETCYVATKKPSIISKLASSFSLSTSKIDPPESAEITNSMGDELDEILNDEVEKVEEDEVEGDAISLSHKHKKEFTLMDDDAKLIYNSKTLCNPKRVTITQLLHDEDVDLDYMNLLEAWPLQVKNLCFNKSDFNPQHAVSKEDRTGIIDVLPEVNNRIRKIIQIKSDNEFPIILEKNLEEIESTLDKCINISLMFTLYLLMKELALYRRIMLSNARESPRIKDEWWYKTHMKEIRHLINNAYSLCCSDLPNFSVGSFNIPDIHTNESPFYTASDRFSHLPPAGRDYILRLVDAMRAEEKNSVTRSTQDQRSAFWCLWKDFLRSCGIPRDNFLDGFITADRNLLVSAFAYSRRHSRSEKPLSSGYIKNAIGHVPQDFRCAGRLDPRLDEQNLQHITLTNLFRKFANEDPPVKHQKAIPLSLLQHMMQTGQSKLQQATVPLLIVALYFCLRSCEYLQTPREATSRRPNPLSWVASASSSKATFYLFLILTSP